MIMLEIRVACSFVHTQRFLYFSSVSISLSLALLLSLLNYFDDFFSSTTCDIYNMFSWQRSHNDAVISFRTNIQLNGKRSLSSCC